MNLIRDSWWITQREIDIKLGKNMPVKNRKACARWDYSHVDGGQESIKNWHLPATAVPLQQPMTHGSLVQPRKEALSMEYHHKALPVQKRK